MKNKNLLLRIITCVVGIPLLGAVIFLFPQHNHIGLGILLILSSLLGSIELSKMIYGKMSAVSYIAWLFPLFCFFDSELADYFLALLIIASFVFEIRGGEFDNFKGSITRIGKDLICALYPSFFISFFIRLLLLPITNSYLIAYFIIMVFSNDIFAYIFGMLFGKNNNNILKASPKKSIAGFIGGLAGCFGISILFTAIFKNNLLFTDKAFKFICPLVMSVFADIGDLVESVIKRSAGVKDSSNLIPGHGGILDRFDSILSTAPIFYIMVRGLL